MGARRVCEGRRCRVRTGGRGLRGDAGGSPDLPGFGKWLLGRHRAAKPTASEFQLVLILSETAQSRAAAAVPPGLPRRLPKRTHCRPGPTAASRPSTRGSIAASTAARTPCPHSHLPVPGLTRPLPLIPRAQALQEPPLHPTAREKNQVTKRLTAQLSAHGIWVA